MNKVIMFFILLLGSNALSGQFDITIRGGGLVDMYKLESNVDDDVYSPWYKNPIKGKPWDYPYLNLEIAYSFGNNHKIGLRYHFEDYWSQTCKEDNFGLECSQINDDAILIISSHYYKKIDLTKKINIQPTIGLGISFSYYDGYINSEKKVITLIGDTDNKKDRYGYEYLDHKIVPFIPLELNVNFQFNKFLIFSLNMGYNQYLRKAITRTEIFYKVNDSEERKATVYTANNMYLGIGIDYHFDILNNKTKK